MDLSHHISTILPYCQKENSLDLLLIQKSEDYKIPYFHNSLAFLGGNCILGVNKDRSPLETLEREIKEEFWMKEDPSEDLNNFFEEEKEKQRDISDMRPSEKYMEKTKSFGKLILNNPEYCATFVVNLQAPLYGKKDLIFSHTVFTKKFSHGIWNDFQNILNENKGKLITENFVYGGQTRILNLNTINKENLKFCGAFDHILNNLVYKNHLPKQQYGVIRTLNLARIEEMDINHCLQNKNISFEDIESQGYKYKKLKMRTN